MPIDDWTISLVRIFSMKKFSILSICASLAVSGFVFEATSSPAQSAVVDFTSSLTSFKQGPSEAVEFGLPAATVGINAIALRFPIGFVVNAPKDCVVPASDAGNCLIKRVSIGGVNREATVENSLASELIIRISHPGERFGPGGAVIIELQAGAFTVPKMYEPHWVSMQTYDGVYNDGDMGQLRFEVAVETDTVSFNSNGGSGTMAAKEFTKNGALPANKFSKDGYVFEGWATSQADADAGTVTHGDKARFAMTGDVELFAVWKLADDTTGGAGSGGSGDSETLADTGDDTRPVFIFGMLVVIFGLLVLESGRGWSRRLSKSEL